MVWGEEKIFGLINQEVSSMLDVKYLGVVLRLQKWFSACLPQALIDLGVIHYEGGSISHQR